MGQIYYNKFFGKLILDKYIKKEDRKYIHSLGVGEFAGRVARRIRHKHPEISNLDPQLVEFLGLVHDIGYSISPELHEMHTIDILVRKENIPPEIAIKTIHGQIPEEYGTTNPYYKKFYPKGVEGMILTYADMTFSNEHMNISQRVDDITVRVKKAPISYEKKTLILEGLKKSLPRFERYEKIILELSGVWRYEHFGIKKRKRSRKKYIAD